MRKKSLRESKELSCVRFYPVIIGRKVVLNRYIIRIVDKRCWLLAIGYFNVSELDHEFNYNRSIGYTRFVVNVCV